MRQTIFIFGSNRLGIHGAGAALYARYHCGAEPGIGEGRTGDAYALPTCSAPGTPLPLDAIARSIERFRDYAQVHPELNFLFTSVGCGHAGYTAGEIAALCTGMPDNVYIQSKLFNAKE